MEIIKKNNRIIEWDIAKALAIIGMIFVHCKIAMIDASAHPIYSFITEFLGSPVSAPIFMFLLGACIPFSSHNNAKFLLKRGCKFFLLSYVMNLLVFDMPFIYRSLIYKEAIDTQYFVGLLFSSDILGFAGLSFIFFAIVKKKNLTIQKVLFLLCLFIVLNKMLLSYCPIKENRFLQFVFGPFYGTHSYSYFPFLSWIGYPIAGYIFSTKINSEKAKETAYKKLGIIGFCVFSILTIISTLHIVDSYSIFIPESGDDERFYNQGLFVYIMFLGWIFFELWVCFLISKVIKQGVFKHLQRWSQNITQMYVISYIPIFIIDKTIFNGNPNLSVGYTLLITFVIFCTADWLSMQYKKVMTKQ